MRGKKILLPLLLSIFIQASGQVYNAGVLLPAYQDINPDTLLNYVYFPYTSETFGIDLFDDPSSDIQFEAHGAVSSGGSAAYMNVTCLNTSVSIRFGRWDSVWITGSSYWHVTRIARPLNAGEAINPAGAMWDNTMLYLTDHSGQSGGNKDVNDWIGGDKYLGIKYDNGSIITYGWMRVQCATKDTCYVKDLSYTPASLAVNEIQSAIIKLYPNPSSTTFYLDKLDANSLDISKLTLADMYGREVKFLSEVKGTVVKIDVGPDLPEGCYVLRYNSNEDSFSKKLVRSSK